jgi:hypothetical protein
MGGMMAWAFDSLHICALLAKLKYHLLENYKNIRIYLYMPYLPGFILVKGKKYTK